MELLDVRDRHTDTALPMAGVSFCAKAPESGGLIPDACPLATREWLIAAAGREGTPPFTVDMGGVDGLYDTLYGDLLPRTEANTRLLVATFGEQEQESVHPIGRYAAVLAEAAALAVLDGDARGVSAEERAEWLGDELERRLGTLYDRLSADIAVTGEIELYGVRLAACRLREEGEGRYTLDILSAGDYRLYLLDAGGLHEVWVGEEEAFLPRRGCVPAVHTVELRHPEPFMLLLLSAGAAAPDEHTPRGREPSGRVWRHRMRLEEAVLHILTACLREQEFGERAAQYFAGHIHHGSAASGTLLICCEEDERIGLIDALRARLHRVEDLLPLLPEQYHPATAPAVPTRTEAERAYLASLLAENPALADRVADVVYLTVLERIRTRGERPTPAADAAETVCDDKLLGGTAPVTDLAPPADSLLDAVLAAHNVVNHEDMAALAENHRGMEDALSEHWVTWRPLFAALPADDTAPRRASAAHRAARERDFAALLVLNTRLAERLEARRRILDDIDELLTSATNRLHGEGHDWLCGRGGDDNAMAWAAAIARMLPERLLRFDAHFRADTDRYRSLLVAYRTERERLFRQDALHPDGFFAARWQAMQRGALSGADWAALEAAADEAELGADYRTRLTAIRRISEGCGALLGRMERRGAERLTARELARRSDLRVEALRASVYGNAAWTTGELLTPEQVRELTIRLRRREESERMATRQKAAFEDYARMYRQF